MQTAPLQADVHDAVVESLACMLVADFRGRSDAMVVSPGRRPCQITPFVPCLPCGPAYSARPPLRLGSCPILGGLLPQGVDRLAPVEVRHDHGLSFT